MKNFDLWRLVKSPKTIAVLKLGIAIAGVIHAIDELRSTSKKSL